MSRLTWFYCLLILSTGILGVRLVYLQIFEGKYYQILADENRVKQKILAATRGEIFDRYGEKLTVSEATGHVLGYTGEADEQEAEQFYLGAIVGKTGLQKQYDQKLRGTDGFSIVEQDANAQELRELKRIEPTTGEDLKTTLDAGLQKKAYELLNHRRGAVVVSDPNTGEILALVSSPGFDPKNLGKYLNDKNLAMFNRALGGEYPPGSTFKVITAVGALEEGAIDGQTQIEDTGEIVIGPYRYTNWYFTQYGKKEGWINIVKALARSNDVFFYQLGEKLGIAKMADWAKYFGFGTETGVDLAGEAKGLMPDPVWKKEVMKEDWYTGDTFITAIGQGHVLTTPLQINQMMSIVAAKGNLCRPTLTKDRIDCKKLDISQKTINLVTEGLKQVCETGGTAWPFFDYKVKVAGKTGTAEFGPGVKSEPAQTHAWFTGFAPIDKPQITVTVLLEGAGEGSYQAAPVAKDLLSYWFERQ
ncbi:MAG: penicillin-binding transpeptidase domain-containing protein [Candidatus Beckwithbacteria bacterium]|nr:penicillin-binding transpeptidase domain-containing protein [Candidatus Beckwithbacteria bacterium]